jgi:hypothetical protein
VLKGKVSLPGKGEAQESLQLHVKRGDYERSIRTFGLEATARSYTLSVDDEFMAREKAHLRGGACGEMMPREPGIHLSSQEMLVNGLWMKIEAHHASDTLHAVLRLVNQSSLDVKIDLPHIHVIHQDSIIRPLFKGIFDPLVVPDGRRAVIHLKFPARRMEIFQLDLKAAFAGPTQSCPVFFSPLLFREASSKSH